MFKQRLLTAIVLAPLTLLLIYYVNNWTFRILILLITLALALEWLRLIPLQKLRDKIVFILALLAMM